MSGLNHTLAKGTIRKLIHEFESHRLRHLLRILRELLFAALFFCKKISLKNSVLIYDGDGAEIYLNGLKRESKQKKRENISKPIFSLGKKLDLSNACYHAEP